MTALLQAFRKADTGALSSLSGWKVRYYHAGLRADRQQRQELLKCVNQYIEQWGLEDGFKKYVNEDCTFCGSTVDRIVRAVSVMQEMQRLWMQRTATDPLTDVGEVFDVWVIEGDEKLNDVLPFKRPD